MALFDAGSGGMVVGTTVVCTGVGAPVGVAIDAGSALAMGFGGLMMFNSARNATKPDRYKGSSYSGSGGSSGGGNKPPNKVNKPSEKAASFEKDISKLPPGERVATIKSKVQEVAKQNKWKKDPILTKKNGRDIYRDPKTKEVYSVDTQHGRFEKCDPKTGRHLGEFDIDLKQTKPADASGSHDITMK